MLTLTGSLAQGSKNKDQYITSRNKINLIISQSKIKAQYLAKKTMILNVNKVINGPNAHLHISLIKMEVHNIKVESQQFMSNNRTNIVQNFY